MKLSYCKKLPVSSNTLLWLIKYIAFFDGKFDFDMCVLRIVCSACLAAMGFRLILALIFLK